MTSPPSADLQHDEVERADPEQVGEDAEPESATAGWFRRLVRPGQLLPALLRWVVRRAANRATWIFLAGCIIGVLVASYLTGPLPRPTVRTGQDVALQFYAGSDSDQDGARHNALTAWNNTEHLSQRITATYHVLNSSADEQRDSLQIALSPKSDTAVDVVVLDNPDVPLFAHLNQLSPLSAVDTSGILQKPLQACAYEGKQWALPLNADAPMIAYNIGLLKQGLGLERLSDDALRERYNVAPGHALYDNMLNDGQRAMKALLATEPGLTGIYAGQFADYEGFTVNILEQLAAQGAAADDPYLRKQTSRDAVVGVTTRLMTPGFLPPGSLSSPVAAASGYQEGQSTQALSNGRVLFARVWPSDYKALNDDAPGRFGEVTMPDGVLGGQCIAVAAKSQHQREARDLVRFLTGDMTQYQLLMDGGYAPIREIVYGEPAARAKYGYLPALLSAIETATPRVRLPYYFRYSQQLRKEIKQAMANGYQLYPHAADRLAAASKGKIA